MNPTDIPEPKAAVAGPNLYFEVLELQPVKLMLSFMRTERSDNGGKDNKYGYLCLMITVSDRVQDERP